MRSQIVVAFGTGLLLGMGVPVMGQTAPAQGADVPESSDEPVVQRIVIEDEGARIEELKVRGAVRSTKVKPKGAIRAEYEIVPIENGRDISDGPHSTKGNAGQRVWRVLSF